MQKELIVSAIEKGTVLDHIPANELFRVIEILDLRNSDKQITFGTNLDSKLLGKKAIIKVSETYFKDKEIDKIALIAPQAKINIIKNFEVEEKRTLDIPEIIEGIVKCANPVCLTNHQKVTSRFKTIKNSDEIKLVCQYCEKTTTKKNLKIISNFNKII